MKKTILILLLFISTLGIAQNLEERIPNSVDLVMSIKATKLFDIISQDQLGEFKISKMFFNQVNRRRKETISTIEEFGIDLNSTCYYTYEKTDSISYHNIYIKLNSKKLFTNNFSSYTQDKIIERKDGVNIIIERKNTFFWNNEMALISFAKISKDYYANIKKQSYSEYSNLESEYLLKKSEDLFFNNNIKSILLNKEYLESINKKSLASIWLKNYNNTINNIDKFKRITKQFKLDIKSSQINTLRSDLFFEEGEINLTTTVSVDKSVSRNLSKIYKAKIGNHFFKYFDINKTLAYASLSINTENLLIETPVIYKNIYGEIFPSFRNEMAALFSMSSCFLDEKAIGKLITGNALLVFSDFDTNRKKPIFTLMIESKDKKLIKKLLYLAKKYQKTKTPDNIIQLSIPNRMNKDLFVCYKDNILFLSPQKEEISKILNNTIKQNIGRHKHLIQDNTSIFYVNTDKIIDKLYKEDNYSSNLKRFKLASKQIEDITFRCNKPKNNKYTYKFIIKTKDKKTNSLIILLNLMEDIMTK